MSAPSNLYHTPDNPERLGQKNTPLRITRSVVVAWLVVLALRAVVQVASSAFKLVTAAPPPPELQNSPLMQEVFDGFSHIYRAQRTACWSGIGFGTALLVMAVCLWIYQRRFFRMVDSSSGELDLDLRFRRCTLCAFAASCIGVLGSAAYPGDPSAIVHAIITWGLEISVLLGSGLSMAAFTLGWDLRIRSRDAFLHYTLAVLAALLTLRPAVLIMIRPIYYQPWQWPFLL